MMRRRPAHPAHPAHPALVIAVLLLLGLAGSASAHPLDIGYLRIDARPEAVTVVLDLDVNAAAILLGLEPDTLDAPSLATRVAPLAAATLGAAPLETDAGGCTWTGATAELRNRTVTITDRAQCPAGMRTLRWSFPFVSRVTATFQLLAKTTLFGVESVAILDKSKSLLEASGEDSSLGFLGFVWSGVEHIGAAPGEWHDDAGFKLADGIDHILFVLALMLAGGTLLRLIGIASGFTLGHTITLALSTLDIVRPPLSVIEPLIALSIALVAVEAMLGDRLREKVGRHRWTIATVFGMVHGFGLASALNVLELSAGDRAQALFGYNLGVELGQIAIMAVTALVLLALRQFPRAYPVVVRVLAVGIFAAGMYWFVERLIG